MRRRRTSGKDQIPLFAGGPGGPRPPLKKRKPPKDPDKMRKDCARFHARHPHVLILFADHCLRLWNEGHRRYSIAAVVENFRWHKHVDGLPDLRETYKLNNNYRATYARMVVALHPELEGMFEFRALKGERRKK